jgi:hypothetical protein
MRLISIVSRLSPGRILMCIRALLVARLQAVVQNYHSVAFHRVFDAIEVSQERILL